MKRLVTALAFIGLMAGVAIPATAQIKDVTVRQINAIPQDSVDALIADGASLTLGTIAQRIFGNDDVSPGDTVKITVVVLSNPKNSGLASISNGIPGRLHIFVRDTSAASLGNAGMGIQIVDNAFSATGSGGLLVGDVVEIVSAVSPFFETMQLVNPISVDPIGSIEDFDLPESILDPEVVTMDQINMSVGPDGATQANWNNLASMRGQYVRVENVSILARDLSNATRPAWSVTGDAGASSMTIRDISLRYRNDRSDYPEDYNAQFDFVPPSPGSVVNLQGFLLMEDFSNVSNYAPEGLQIAPFEDSDLEITVAAPQVIVNALTEIPGADPFDVTATVTADPTRTLTSVTVSYYSTASADTVHVAATNTTGDTYSAPIPSPGDTEFVTYWFTAEDNVATVNRSADASYKVLEGGITTIQDIQTTADGGAGSSPFVGLTTAMNIDAIVMSDPGVSGFYSIQSDEGLAPWSGIRLTGVSGLNRGDMINITEATIEESFGLTRLRDVVYTVTGTGTPYDYKLVTTDALADPGIVEAHESMMLRFENVTVASNNADGPSSDFGEFIITNTDLENGLRVDDESSVFNGSGLNLTFDEGDVIAHIQGLLTYSFSNFKLLPEGTSDIGDVNVAVDAEELGETFALLQNYPNPFTGQTTITFAVDTAADVSLVVYDVLGREVRTLVSGTVTAGQHTATFDSNGLGSGLYLYRLKAGDRTITRSMLVAR